MSTGPPSKGPGDCRSPYNPGNTRPPFNSSNQRGTTHQKFSPQGQGRPSYSNSNQTRQPLFKAYLNNDEVEAGLSSGELIKGSLRVNQRNYLECYLDNPDGDDQADILILGMNDRNRALQADVVVVRMKSREHWVVRDGPYNVWKQGQLKDAVPPAELSPSLEKAMGDLGIAKTPEVVKTPTRTWSKPQKKNNTKLLREMTEADRAMPDCCLQPTAEVVAITEKKHSRLAVGQLKLTADGNHNWALFSATDSRMPRMLIPAAQLPTGFFERPQDFEKFIFLAKMEEWQTTAQFARGKLERTLGAQGDIEAETEGMLIENHIDTREFSDAALACLPITQSSQWSIDEKEFAYRRDLRETTIFTIDPMTARDLDDALSIDACEDIDGLGTPGWEMGVHIADVSHFVQEGNELDQWASARATSTYLVHKVIPMLPRILCEELCSLNPGVDRLAFSVIWKMDREGNVKQEWFGRTIIRSCVKLSYEHAQDMIDHPDKDFATDELPAITNGRTPADVKTKVLALHSVAMHLRQRRQENGSLRLDQPKLKFALDDETKLPFGVTIYERKDSNSLVEEFMLLANMAVAKKIEERFTTTSVLRRHPPPKQKIMQSVLEMCQRIGFPLDASSSGLLSSSLRKFEGNHAVQTAVNQVLSSFMMKPMQLARYFCTGAVKSKSDYHHYALNVQFYTHFTSPIRRYADVMVHRLLAAVCDYDTPYVRSPNDIQKIAEHCNDRKVAAKNVSDKSSEMYFGLFVKQAGPLNEKAVVINVLDQAFDVLVLKYGVTTRVYCDRLAMAREPVFFENPTPCLTLFWKKPDGKEVEQQIMACSVVDVVLTALDQPTKYQAVIKMCSTKDSKTLNDLMEML